MLTNSDYSFHYRHWFTLQTHEKDEPWYAYNDSCIELSWIGAQWTVKGVNKSLSRGRARAHYLSYTDSNARARARTNARRASHVLIHLCSDARTQTRTIKRPSSWIFGRLALSQFGTLGNLPLYMRNHFAYIYLLAELPGVAQYSKIKAYYLGIMSSNFLLFNNYVIQY